MSLDKVVESMLIDCVENQVQPRIAECVEMLAEVLDTLSTKIDDCVKRIEKLESETRRHSRIIQDIRELKKTS